MWLARKKLGVPQETVQLICSFHQGMKAKIRLDGSLLEQIDVQWPETRLLHGTSSL